MKKLTVFILGLLLLTTSACGSPFESNLFPDSSPPGDEEHRVGASKRDAGKDAAADPPPETGARETGRDTWRPDVVSSSGDTGTSPKDTGPVDTGSVDTGPVDTGPADTGPVDTGPVDTGCTPFPPATITCGGMMMSEPENYCVSYGGGGYPTPTPVECQCASTYTCACLEAHGICPMGTLVMCYGPGLVECS